MFCIRCGTEIPQGSAFCHRCGAPVTPVEPTAPSRAVRPRRPSAVPLAVGAVVVVGVALLIAVPVLLVLLAGALGGGEEAVGPQTEVAGEVSGAVTSPTAGPVPTEVPTAPVAPKVTLVSDNAFVTESSLLLDGESRRLHIVAELRNDSPREVELGEMSIRIYDGSGRFIGQRRASPFAQILPPGGVTALTETVPSMSYWSDEIGDFPEGWARYEIQPAAEEVGFFRRTELTVEDVAVSTNQFGGMSFSGLVLNDSSVNASSVTVEVLLYDDAGRIVNAAAVKPLGDDPSAAQAPILKPGERLHFQVDFGRSEVPGYKRYAVYAYDIGVPEGASEQVLPPDRLPLDIVSYDLDIYDYISIVGEVRNNTGGWVRDVDVSATLYDPSGAIIGADVGTTLIYLVGPGEVAPFLLIIEGDASQGISRTDLRVSGSPTSERRTTDLEVVEESAYLDSYTGDYHVMGQVRNNGVSTYTMVEVVATFYDSSGKVVAYGTGGLYIDIPPNEAASFDVIVVDEEAESIARYDLKVEGEER
jgi:hypothetical protein